MCHQSRVGLVATVIAAATTVAAEPVAEAVQAVAEARAAAVVARRGRALNLALHAAANHAGAGHRFLVRHAHADLASDLARHLAGFADGVLLRLLFPHALDVADLDLLFAPFGLAHRHLDLALLLDADLLADLDRAALVLRAEDPHVAGARASVVAAIVARIVAAAVVAVAAEESAAAAFTAFPVTQAFQPFLHDGLFHGPPHLLADLALFAHGHFVADLADFFFPDRDLLHAGDLPFFLHLNGLTAEAVDGFLTAFDFIHRALDGVLLRDALGDADGASGGSTGGAARRRTVISPSG